MTKTDSFKHYHRNIRAVIKWIYDNKIERIRLKDISDYTGRAREERIHLEGKPNPPTIKIDDAFHLSSLLISKGLAEPFVSDTRVEFLDFKFSENDRTWRKLRGHWGIFSRIKDAFLWILTNLWLIGLWAVTVIAARLLSKILDI